MRNDCNFSIRAAATPTDCVVLTHVQRTQECMSSIAQDFAYTNLHSCSRNFFSVLINTGLCSLCYCPSDPEMHPTPFTTMTEYFIFRRIRSSLTHMGEIHWPLKKAENCASYFTKSVCIKFGRNTSLKRTE